MLIFSELFQWNFLKEDLYKRGRGNPENKCLEVQLRNTVMTKKSFITLTTMHMC